MTCEEIQSGELAEHYFAGKLTEPERDRFEEHYFACDSCWKTIRDIRATRQALQSAGVGPALAAIPPRRPVRFWAPAAIAAALVAAIALGWMALKGPRIPPTPPAVSGPNLERIARLDPPPFKRTPLRGAESNAEKRFRVAMEPYESKDYVSAAQALRKTLDRDPDSFDARYFLAICDLLTGRIPDGIAGLKTVVDAGNRSPYLEEAHFYLAKVYAGQRRLVDARREFEITVALHGDLETEARSLLEQLK